MTWYFLNCKCVGEGGSGLGFNGVKSCNSRQENMKMPFHKTWDGKLYSFHNLEKGNIEKG